MLMAGGNLIKKVLFPAEVLPVVIVLTNLVQFLLGLPILFAFLLVRELPGAVAPLAIALVHLVPHRSGSVLFVSALAVYYPGPAAHILHVLMLWFSDPGLYSVAVILEPSRPLSSPTP